MAKFDVGDYVIYHGKVYIVDAYYEDIMFIRNIDTDALEIVLEWEYDEVKEY